MKAFTPHLLKPRSSSRTSLVRDKERGAGFTLLEVLIATLLITIGTLAIIRALSAGLFTSSDTQSVACALDIANAKLEEIRNTAFSNITSTPAAPDANFRDYWVSVTAATGQDPMPINVTVAWNTTGGQTSIKLTTLRANYY
jgi:Tfp pilus assembly protein PilV